MNVFDGILTFAQPGANAAATNAANAALDNIAARPFNVVISVDQATKQWLTLLGMGITAALLLLSKRKA